MRQFTKMGILSILSLAFAACEPDDETSSSNTSERDGRDSPDATGSDGDTPASCFATACPALTSWECPSISECDSVLSANGRIATTNSGSEIERQRSRAADWLCSTDNTTSIWRWLESNSTSGGGTISLDGVGSLGGSGSRTTFDSQEEFESWQRSTCRSQVNSASSEELSQFFSEFEDTTSGISAWESCVAQVMSRYGECARAAGLYSEGQSAAVQGLTLLPPAGTIPAGGTFQVLIRWCGVVGSSIAHAAEVESISLAGMECDLEAGAELCTGGRVLTCTRTTERGVSFAVNIRASPEGGASPSSLSAQFELAPLCGWSNQPCCDGACSFSSDECVAGTCVLTNGSACIFDSSRLGECRLQ
jgi:hypothetical protein